MTTYDELKSIVADYLGAGDEYVNRIPTFIRLAEKRIERDVRLRVMEKRAAMDVNAGVRGVELPARREPGAWQVFMEMRDVAWIDGGEAVNLEYLPVDDWQRMNRETGRPRGYTIIGDDLFLCPCPDRDGRLELAFYAEIPPLSAEHQHNEVLHLAPDLYLYATLLESIPYTRGSVPGDMWMRAYQEAVAKVNKQEQRGRFTAQITMKPARRA